METLNRIIIWFASGIYTAASWAFELFFSLAGGQLINSDNYQSLLNNTYLIIGVIMLFILAFALLKGMVNPDDQSKTTTTVKKIVINLVTSGILIAVLPTIFTFAYDFQRVFMSSNIIGSLFGYGTPNFNEPLEDDMVCKRDEEIKLEARNIVDGVFTAFLNVNPDLCPSNVAMAECQNLEEDGYISAEDVAGINPMTFLQTSNFVKNTGNWKYYTAFSKNIVDGYYDLNHVLILIGGLLLIYVAISYCFDMALRLVKLVFYQVIAPFPILCRIIPEGNLSEMFNKWVKITLTCYLEVYVRILVIYFSIYICKVMLQSTFLDYIAECSVMMFLLSKAFIIMGLIMFMRQVPKLFSDITGIDSGNMKLGIKEKMKDSGLFSVGNAVGGFIGGATGGNFLTGVTGGFQGLKHGWNNADLKGIGYAYARGYEYKDARSAGASITQIWADSFRRDLGLPTWAEMEERKIDQSNQTIQNTTSAPLPYIDNHGSIQYLQPGESKVLSYKEVESFDELIAKNNDKKSVAEDKVRTLNNKIASADARISSKSTIKNEAIKDIDDGKITDIWYTRYRDVTEIDGRYYIDDGINGRDEKEVVIGSSLSLSDGRSFFVKGIEKGRVKVRDFSGREGFLGDEHHYEGTWSAFENYYNNDLSPDDRQQIDMKPTKDKLIEKRIASESKAIGDNTIKDAFRAGYEQIAVNGDEGWSFEEYIPKKDEFGNDTNEFETDESGNYITKKGKIVVTRDSSGRYTAEEIIYIEDSDGKLVEDSRTVLNNTDHSNDYEVFDKIDAHAKNTKNVLNGRVRNIQLREIDPIKRENENLEAAKGQADKAREARKKSSSFKKRQASQKFVGNRKNGS